MKRHGHAIRLARTEPSPSKLLRRLTACRRGAVSIELAAVAIPFFLLLCGMIELGLMTVSGAVLDGASREAARQIRTGQAQDSADPIATFRTRLCGELSGMLDCNRVVMDVRSFPDFGSVSVPPLYDAEGNVQPTAFEAGEPGEIVVVRTTMRWTFLTPLLSQVIGSSNPVASTFVFRNEPYKGPL